MSHYSKSLGSSVDAADQPLPQAPRAHRLGRHLSAQPGAGRGVTGGGPNSAELRPAGAPAAQQHGRPCHPGVGVEGDGAHERGESTPRGPTSFQEGLALALDLQRQTHPDPDDQPSQGHPGSSRCGNSHIWRLGRPGHDRVRGNAAGKATAAPDGGLGGREGP